MYGDVGVKFHGLITLALERRQPVDLNLQPLLFPRAEFCCPVKQLTFKLQEHNINTMYMIVSLLEQPFGFCDRAS